MYSVESMVNFINNYVMGNHGMVPMVHGNHQI